MRFSLSSEGEGLIESTGNHGIDKSERLSAAERAAITTMGFAAPTRRVHERHWRLATPGNSVAGIAAAVTGVLGMVHGLKWGDRIEVDVLPAGSPGAT